MIYDYAEGITDLRSLKVKIFPLPKTLHSFRGLNGKVTLVLCLFCTSAQILSFKNNIVLLGTIEFVTIFNLPINYLRNIICYSLFPIKNYLFQAVLCLAV